MMLSRNTAVRVCLAILLAALMCSLAGACAKTPGVVTGAWSAPADGVAAALRVDSSAVSRDGELLISVVFKNLGDLPRALPVAPYFTVNVSLDGVPIADAIGNADIPEDEPALQPGEERAYRLEGLRTDTNGPGVYSLEGVIGAMELARVEVKVATEGYTSTTLGATSTTLGATGETTYQAVILGPGDEPLTSADVAPRIFREEPSVVEALMSSLPAGIVVRSPDCDHLIVAINVVGAAESAEGVEVYADLQEDWLTLDGGQGYEYIASTYPVRIRLAREGDTFRLDGVDRPKDGSGYLTSLDEMFPAWARDLLDTQAAHALMRQALRTAALEWAAPLGIVPATGPTTTTGLAEALVFQERRLRG